MNDLVEKDPSDGRGGVGVVDSDEMRVLGEAIDNDEDDRFPAGTGNPRRSPLLYATKLSCSNPAGCRCSDLLRWQTSHPLM